MNNELLVIDLSACTNTGEIINNVSNALESSAQGCHRAITIKLSDTILNQAQLMSIQSLILSYDAKLVNVETDNEPTAEACRSLGIEAVKPQYIEAPKTITAEEIAFTIEPEVKTEEQNEDFVHFEVPQSSDVEEEKQSMDVYKKAYDEEQEEEKTWEEVDYYAPATDEPVIIDSKQTIYVNQTLRSGQVLEFDGNVIIIGDCHPGSEIKATGDITVWGVLGSIAHAGAKGNRDAKIRALKMNAVQLRIADCYSRRPDGTNIPYIIKSSVFTPEEARIVDDSIVLFKIN